MWRAWRELHLNWYGLKLVGLHKSLNGRMKTHSSDHVYENNAASSTGWGIFVCLKLWKRVHMQVRAHSSQSRTKKPPIAVPWCLTERGLLFVPCLNMCTCTQTHSHTKSQLSADKTINYKMLPGHFIYDSITYPRQQMLSVKNAFILICLWLMCGVNPAFIKQAWSTSTGGAFN